MTPCFQHDSYRRDCGDCRDMNDSQPMTNNQDREGEGLHQVLRRLNDNLASAPHDAEKCFVSLDDHRTLVAALAARTQPPASEGLVTDAIERVDAAIYALRKGVTERDWNAAIREARHAARAALQAQPAADVEGAFRQGYRFGFVAGSLLSMDDDWAAYRASLSKGEVG